MSISRRYFTCLKVCIPTYEECMEELIKNAEKNEKFEYWTSKYIKKRFTDSED